MASVKDTTPHSVQRASAAGATGDRRKILSHRGSWITDGQWIDVPYDLETGYRPFPVSAPQSLSTLRNAVNAANGPFTLLAEPYRVVHLISAMGVVLGDSL